MHSRCASVSQNSTQPNPMMDGGREGLGIAEWLRNEECIKMTQDMGAILRLYRQL